MFRYALPQKVASTGYGVNSGLIVYVNTSVNDFFYTTEPYIGVRVSFLPFYDFMMISGWNGNPLNIFF